MRLTVKKALLLAAFAIGVGGASPAFAQESLVAEVPFPFVIAGTSHEAGKYQLHVVENTQAIEFKGPAKAGGFAEIMTRLGGAETHGSEGRLVFDKIGTTYYLSEMWLPDQEGYLIYAPKEPHTHHVVKLHKNGRTS